MRRRQKALGFMSTCTQLGLTAVHGAKRKHRCEVKSLSHVRVFATLWTVACQASPSMGFSRQEYWSGLPFPSPGDLPEPGIKPGSPSLEADALTSELLMVGGYTCSYHLAHGSGNTVCLMESLQHFLPVSFFLPRELSHQPVEALY